MAKKELEEKKKRNRTGRKLTEPNKKHKHLRNKCDPRARPPTHCRATPGTASGCDTNSGPFSRTWIPFPPHLLALLTQIGRDLTINWHKPAWPTGLRVSTRSAKKDEREPSFFPFMFVFSTTRKQNPTYQVTRVSVVGLVVVVVACMHA